MFFSDAIALNNDTTKELALALEPLHPYFPATK
jgi:hypothetical protein